MFRVPLSEEGSERGFIAAVILAAVLFALTPWAAAIWTNRGLLHVPPEFADDSEFYYAQMHTVAQGNLWIGNPYFKEHVGEIGGSFFGAVWIDAAVLVIGVPMMPTILIDLAVAFAVLSGMLIWVCKQLGMRRWWLAASIAAVLSVSFWMMIRPVSMQIVIPSFVFFLSAYLLWMKRPDSWHARALLIVASALSFYIYTFLWQIVVVVLGVSHLFILMWRRRQIPSLLLIDAATIALALPVLWYTYAQTHHMWYWQMITRTGFVETHTIGSAAIIATVITGLTLGAVWILGIHRTEKELERNFFGITGISILITAFSNVITGKDLELSIHIIRFTYVWAALAGIFALYTYFESLSWDLRTGIARLRGLVAIGLLAVFAFTMFHTLYVFRETMSLSTLAAQAYSEPLQWLNENTPMGSVIFADDAFSYYVPVLTDDFVLFQPDGGLYLMSDTELQDRYLASRMFDALSLANIERDLRLYAGAGNALDAYMTKNRWSKLCRLLAFAQCPTLTDPVSYMGAPYFTDLYQRYQDVVLKDPVQVLTRFNVSYIVKDTAKDQNMRPEQLHGAKLVATVGRFEIFTFTPSMSDK